MKKPPALANEAQRLALLHDLDILDTPPEETFDRITRIASAVTGVPMALISLVDHDRQWFKSALGLDVPQTARDVAFCAHAIAHETPLDVIDTQRDERFADNPLVIGDPGIRFYFGVPLTVAPALSLGTLCVLDRRPRRLDARQRATLQDLAAIVVRELQLRRAAVTDPLTGAYNRRQLQRSGAQAVALSRRTGKPFCVAALDLDHFKRVNDNHGHDAGDAVLRHTAHTISANLRTEDNLFRSGGEEFTVLINATLEQGLVLMKRLCATLREQAVSIGDARLTVTCSIGLSVFRGGEDSLQALLRRADEALYEAKQGGRDRVVTRA